MVKDIDLNDIFEENLFKRKFSKEHREKISKAKIGKSHSKEHCHNISRALSGKTFTPEHRRKISHALMGNTNAAKNKERVSNDLLKLYWNNEECKNWILMNKDKIDSFDDIRTDVQLSQDNLKESNIYNDGILSAELSVVDNEVYLLEFIDLIRYIKADHIIID